MNSPALSRLGAACGAVFAVVLFLANGDGSGQFSGPRAVAGLAALTLAIPFLSYLISVLRSAAEDGDRWLAATAAGAGLAWVTLKLSSGAAELASAQSHVASGSSLGTVLNDLAGGVTIISLYPLAICCAAVAVLALRTRALPRWLAIGAAVTAVALAVNGGFLTTSSVPALLLFVLWTLVASGYLLWRTRRPVPVAAAGTPDPAADPALR